MGSVRLHPGILPELHVDAIATDGESRIWQFRDDDDELDKWEAFFKRWKGLLGPKIEFPIAEGWLEEQVGEEGKRKSWKRRWFVCKSLTPPKTEVLKMEYYTSATCG